MPDFIFITANDIHISDNGPRSRVDDFKETVLGKIRQIGLAANKLNADATLIAGDLFNLKNPAKNSHNLNRELIRVLRTFKKPRYMIEGNHDLTANRLDSLEKQPLGVLFADDSLTQLREEIIEKDGVKVSVVGVPFREDFDPQAITLPDKGDCVAQICLLHIYAAPTPGMLFKERIFGYKELIPLGADIYVIGHYHLDQGIEEVEGKYFVNLGSITRGTLSDEDVSHKPKIGFIKISVDNGVPTYTLQSINLKVKSVDEVFDLKKREEEKKEAGEIEAFVNKLMTDSFVGSKQDYEAVLTDMEMAKAVKDKVLHFLHEAKAK